MKNSRLNHIMRLYERIRLSCEGKQLEVDVKNLILFPEGVVSVPGNNVPESDDLRHAPSEYHVARNRYG